LGTRSTISLMERMERVATATFMSVAYSLGGGG